MQHAESARTKQVVYDDDLVRLFTLASVIWGAVALAVGVLIATQLPFWQANFGIQWTSFGRLRPLHTNGAIFAFVGNMMFAGIYYSTQRLLKTRMASDLLGRVNFWGWQLIILGAAITLPLGLTQSKEYAELIWPLDILVAIVWVVFAVNFFWTLAIRNEPNLYVSLWFYIATIVTIPVLYIVNNLQLPTSFIHSYPVYAGVQDALVQWWYGHNAVGFFLTTPILGIMYYFIPKAAGRPVYSYRLSVVHFWALVFVYIWAGPHHLLNTALPDWAQTLGTVFSVMLIAPSWGGMINGLLTLRGAWDRLRTDPVLKFFVAAVTFYGMSTFEGPLLSIKAVNGLAHYTDWIIGHVHGGALGWNGFMAAGMFYWLVPKLWNRQLHSVRWAETHFWIGTFGILLYMVAMWINGVNQGLYWRALDADGFLKYPDFIQGLVSGQFLYVMRLVGGGAYLVGFVLMMANLTMTIRAGERSRVETTVMVPAPVAAPSVWQLIRGTPVVLSAVAILLAVALGRASRITSPLVLTAGAFLAVVAILIGGMERRRSGSWHRLVESRPLAFTLLVLLAILVGGVVELIPTIVVQRAVPVVAVVAEAAPVTGAAGAGDTAPAAAAATPTATPTATPPAPVPAPAPAGEPVSAPGGASTPPATSPAASAAPALDPRFVQQPYSPLELEGRDIYVSEGCYNCHSQMVRPMRHETLRYGEYSRLEEFVYDHPFQWGSKRTGLDLHRVGGKYPNLWHYQHMTDPRSTSPGSNMPSYAWMKTSMLRFDRTQAKLAAMRKLGVPYTDAEIAGAKNAAIAQAKLIQGDLANQGARIAPESRMIALIAYLQRLGRGPQFTDASPAATGGR
jgi:cytochrome c oxidase cbb3-type subunit I/II